MVRLLKFGACLSLLFAGCMQAGGPSSIASTETETFEYVHRLFNERYALLDSRGVTFESSYTLYKSRVFDGMGNDSLWAVLTQWLQTLNDPHVQLVAPNRRVWFGHEVYQLRPNDDHFDLPRIASRLTSKQTGEGYLVGRLGGMGYLHCSQIGYQMEKLAEAIQLAHADSGLIIDLRHNEGGDFTFALKAFEQLNAQRRRIFSSRTKNGPGKNDFTPWFDWHLEASAQPFTRKVVVLTDRYTFSAGERSVMMLRSLPNVLLVGDTTLGGISTVIPHTLPNGWIVRVSIQQVLSPAGEAFEGLGIAPDVFVDGQPLPASDAPLDSALAILRRP
jgi:hypothetical protein